MIEPIKDILNCPLCGSEVKHESLVVNYNAGYREHKDHIKECSNCNALLCVSSDDEKDIKILLIKHLFGLYNETGCVYLRDEEIAGYEEKIDFAREKVDKDYDLNMSSVAGTFYIYGIRKKK